MRTKVRPFVRPATAVGSEGERAAAIYLATRGYHILEHNFRCRSGEIDLIALDGATLVFVEVKIRRTLARGAPLEAVTSLKQNRVRKAAQLYLSYCGRIFKHIRFDIVCVVKTSKTHGITHLKSAFTPG